MRSLRSNPHRKFLLCGATALALLAGNGCKEEPLGKPDPTVKPQPPSVLQPPASNGRKRTAKQRGRKTLANALKALRKTEAHQYLSATTEQAENYRSWLRHLGNAIQNRSLPSMAPASGFTGSLLEGGRLWMLNQSAGTNTGAAALALRVQQKQPLILEAPHTFFDTKTLSLTLSLFETTGAQAVLVNTLHRGGVGPENERIARVRRGMTESDAAHNPQGFFHLAHLELIRLWPHATVIQLHGFRDEKVPRAKIIVSAAGTRARIAPLARALNDTLGPSTAALYPTEVSQLGGTTNAQAAASRKEGTAFIHLELAASLRTRLARQPELRKRFAQALKKGLAVR